MNLLRNSNETDNDYIHRICLMKEENKWTWQDIADILNTNLKLNLSKDAYRMRDRNYIPSHETIEEIPLFNDNVDLNEMLLEMKKERVKISDIRSDTNAMIRRMAREDTIVEIAVKVASEFDKTIKLPQFRNKITNDTKTEEKEGILLLSDWHYGIEINNHYNIYNPDIAVSRLNNLLEQVKCHVLENNIKHIHVVNLGDLISGRIHNTIRISNRIDVITQTIQVSELLAEFINSLSELCYVDYHDTLDNHSRLEPNLKDSLDLESLTRVVTEFLKLRLCNNDRVFISDNYFGDDIITFDVLGHQVIGVHGDKDKPGKVIDSLTTMTQEHYDLVCTAHLHHFSADEKNFTRRITNGSLMGTDDFAESLRLTSKPSQTFIVSTKESVTYCVYVMEV